MKQIRRLFFNKLMLAVFIYDLPNLRSYIQSDLINFLVSLCQREYNCMKFVLKYAEKFSSLLYIGHRRVYSSLESKQKWMFYDFYIWNELYGGLLNYF